MHPASYAFMCCKNKKFDIFWSYFIFSLTIGGRRFSEGTSADREIQRTLMEVNILGVFLLRFLSIHNKYCQMSNFVICTAWFTWWLCDLFFPAAEPDGWFRCLGAGEDDNGNKSSGYTWSCPATTWTVRQEDRCVFLISCFLL